MASYTGMILTTKGKILQIKAEAGTVLNFTKVKVGEGTLAQGQTLEALNDLVSPKLELAISSVLANGGLCHINSNITNEGLSQGFYVREVGLFATDPDLGEILYAVSTATVADYLPPANGTTVVTNQFEIIVVVGSAANITTTISVSGYVMLDDFNDHIQGASAHGATSTATPSRIIMRDATGRAKIAAPYAEDDIARKDTVDAHSTQTGAHGATSAAVAGRIIVRDANGRAKIAAPSASDDIARKDTVDAVQEKLTAHIDGSTNNIPTGLISMWSGSISAIPTGWSLCNGSNGTPDLRDKFIVGAGSTYAVGVTGGEPTHTLTITEMPSHTHTGSTSSNSHSHTGSTNTTGSHTHSYTDSTMTANSGGIFGSGSTGVNTNASKTTDSQGSHSHTVSIGSDSHSHTIAIDSIGNGAAHENRPPYYSLAYIMKL